MYVELGQEHAEIAGAVRAVLQEPDPDAVLRDAWAVPDSSLARAQWNSLAEIGVFRLLAPQPEGLGMGAVDVIAVFREIGYAGCSGPLVAQTVYAPVLAHATRTVDLSRILDGSPVLAVGSDTSGLIPHAGAADLLCRHVGGEILVYRSSDVLLEQLPSLDESRRSARILGQPQPLLVVPLTKQQSVRLDRLCRLAISAQLVGIAHRMLDMTVVYVQRRVQFDAPIGTFQAIQHSLASVRVQIDRTWPSVIVAAARDDTDDPDAEIDTAVARVVADEAANLAARVCLQAHGAMGYTREYQLHTLLGAVWSSRGDFGTMSTQVAAVQRNLAERRRASSRIDSSV